MKVMGETTSAIVFDATAADLKSALETLASVREVSVQLHDAAADGAGALCDPTGAASVITFTHNSGNIPTMIAQSDTLIGSGGEAATLSVLSAGTSSSQGGVASQDGTCCSSVSISLLIHLHRGLMSSSAKRENDNRITC